MQVDSMEGNHTQEVNTRHHHACHPEEDDIVPRLYHRCGIIAQQVGSYIRPTKCTERPQPRTEPGIQDILILVDVGALTMGTDGYVFATHRHLAAVVTVPYRDTMPPPELTRDAPVMNIFQPVQVDFVEALRHNLHQAVLHRAYCRRRERHHLDEPLLRDERLKHSITALAMTDRHDIILGLDDEAKPLQLCRQIFACFEAVLSGVGTSLFCHLPIEADHLHTRQIVAQTNLEVGWVMGRRYLHRPCTEGGVYYLICYNW